MATFLTHEEAAKHLGIPPEGVVTLIEAGTLKAYANPPGQKGYKITADAFGLYLKCNQLPLGQWGVTVVVGGMGPAWVLALNQAAGANLIVAHGAETVVRLGMAIERYHADCVVLNFQVGPALIGGAAEDIRNEYPNIAIIALFNEEKPGTHTGAIDSFLPISYNLTALVAEIRDLIEKKKNSIE